MLSTLNVIYVLLRKREKKVHNISVMRTGNNMFSLYTIELGRVT